MINHRLASFMNHVCTIINGRDQSSPKLAAFVRYHLIDVR